MFLFFDLLQNETLGDTQTAGTFEVHSFEEYDFGVHYGRGEPRTLYKFTVEADCQTPIQIH